MTFFGWADGIADALFNISLPEGAMRRRAPHRGCGTTRTRGISLFNIGGGVRTGDDVERAKLLFGANARPLLHLKQVFAPSRSSGSVPLPVRKRPADSLLPPYHSTAHD